MFTGTILFEPTLTISFFWIAAKSFDCNSIGMFPISSRNNVPPEAISNLPGLSSFASVNAPLTWPNNSLSKRVWDIEPISTLTKTLSTLLELRCIARAINSLPVPFSPRIRTSASVSATFLIVLKTFFIGSDVPMISLKPNSGSSLRNFCCVFILPNSRRDSRNLTAEEKVASSFSFCQGFKTKSVAPSFTARTAVSTSP